MTRKLFPILWFFAVYLNAAVVPSAGIRYYLLQSQTLSGKVIGRSDYNEVIITDCASDTLQQFEFIPVEGKSDTYYLKCSDGNYLLNSTDVPTLTEYDSEMPGTNAEWILQGSALSEIRLRNASSIYLGTDDYNSGSLLMCNKSASDAQTTFKLVAADNMVSGKLVDAGFEQSVVEGTPLGIWVNDNSRTLGNNDASTQNYRSRVVNNGYQCSGNNAFLLRFYGDENSYTKISRKITGLEVGATYEFLYNYKQGNSNASDATVNCYATINANAESSDAISTMFTSTPPSTTASTQSVQSALISFVAPAKECYIVWAKNSGTSKNYIQYIDDLSLVKTADAEPSIHSTTTSVVLDDENRTAVVNITGALLSDSIRVSVPDGLKTSVSSLSPDASNVGVTISFVGFETVSSEIIFSSGTVSLKIPVTVTYSTTFVQPDESEIYYIQQRTGGKVVGLKSTGDVLALRYAQKDEPVQEFSFTKVQGHENSYYIHNANNQFLNTFNDMLVFGNAENASRWVLQGSADLLVYITDAANSAAVIGCDSMFNDNIVYGNKLKSAANSAFALQLVSDVDDPYMFDGSFEHNPMDGGPLGEWIPSDETIQLGNYGYSRVQSGTGWASTGKKCMYMRFLSDGTSYSSISQKLYNLIPGATYRLDLNYKCQSTSATSLVNIYAATTPNASKTLSLGGIYSSTTVATSNLYTQSPQSTSLTFVAPRSDVYVIYAKNTSSTYFNFFVDDLTLTETIPSALNSLKENKLVNAYFANESLHIISLASEDLKVSIVSVAGKTIVPNEDLLAGQELILNQLQMPNGIYLLKISSGKSMSVVKLSKKD
ncbi:MAG: T9SS type A sorting domain-containing protein [Paludibacter sp.]|nr:T9SS type A sorting domain-containing protein [Paludibacter sp.]